jgi:nuclear pore complex protein Nup93
MNHAPVSSSSIDRYQHAVVNLVGYCDPFFRNPGIMDNIEDFLWQIQWFATMSPTPRESIWAKVVTLIQPSDFNHATITGVFEYVRLLFTTCQFETAVESLAAKGFMVEAVHLGLVLHYFGLLDHHVNKYHPYDARIHTIQDGFFTRLIRQYVHLFQRTDPQVAAMYIACHQSQVVRRLLFCQLLLDTRVFDDLAGHTHPQDMARTPGALDQYIDRAEVSIYIYRMTTASAWEPGRSVY